MRSKNINAIPPQAMAIAVQVRGVTRSFSMIMPSSAANNGAAATRTRVFATVVRLMEKM